MRLFAGLVLFGVSLALMVRADIGLGPWDVFHQGVAQRIGLSIGLVVNLTAIVVLLLWIPLRQRPGIGTVANVVVVGLVTDGTLWLLPDLDALAPRIALLVAGILANAVATGLYVGAGLGPGPRDGLMTGLAARGHSIRLVRTLIELTVLVIGWLLGGSVGVGTIVYALAIGPLVGVFLPLLTVAPRPVVNGEAA
ncbi:membrane protein [Asanoa ferruginea]|nr:membrane protein [Asanoa ferruginea]